MPIGCDVVPTACSCGDHVFAPTNRGLNVMVSPEDAALLERKWFAYRLRFPRVIRVRRVNGKQRCIALARLIMAPPDDMEVDHINRDPLDNRRSNLRVCTHLENSWNRLYKRNEVGLKGVYEARGRYRALIMANGVKHYLGSFATPEEAHAAYAEAASRHHGKFARVA